MSPQVAFQPAARNWDRSWAISVEMSYSELGISCENAAPAGLQTNTVSTMDEAVP